MIFTDKSLVLKIVFNERRAHDNQTSYRYIIVPSWLNGFHYCSIGVNDSKFLHIPLLFLGGRGIMKPGIYLTRGTQFQSLNFKSNYFSKVREELSLF